MDFVYKYKGNRCSFTLDSIAHLKTKEDFKKVFDGLVDVDPVWKDVEKHRPKPKKKEKEEKERGTE